MKYRNVLTGIVIDFRSEISGENWEPVEAPEVPEKPEEPEKKAVKKNAGRNKK